MQNKRGQNRSFSQYNFFTKNRRGQGLPTSTIILLILGVAILVILILGFVIGWNKILPWLSASNVDDIKTACDNACLMNSEYNFCLSTRNLKSDTEELKEITCNFLAQKKPIYNIAACSSITCDNVVIVELAAGEQIDSKCTDNTGKVIQALSGDTLVSKECTAA